MFLYICGRIKADVENQCFLTFTWGGGRGVSECRRNYFHLLANIDIMIWPLRWQYSWTQSKKCKCIFKLCKKNFYTCSVVLFNSMQVVFQLVMLGWWRACDRKKHFEYVGFLGLLRKNSFSFSFFPPTSGPIFWPHWSVKQEMKLVRPNKELSEKAAGCNWVHQHIGGIGIPGWGKVDRRLVWWPADYPWTRKIPQQDITANQMTELIRIMLFAAQNGGHQCFHSEQRSKSTKIWWRKTIVKIVWQVCSK